MKQGVANDNWSEAAVQDIQTRYLNDIFASKIEESVEVAVAFVSYLRITGISEQNYPLFLKIFEMGHRVVIDALIGDADPFLLMAKIPPQRYLLHECYHLLTLWNAGGIYPKTLSIILGVLQISYAYPKEGYRIYAVTINDINNLAKHLSKEKGQSDPVNRAILDILDRLSSLMGSNDWQLEQVARQCNQIRSHFFENRRSLDEVIPQVLLVAADYREEEVLPRTVFQS